MATADNVKNLNLSILRMPLSEDEIAAVALRIEAGATSTSRYRAALLQRASRTSIPALIVSQIFYGEIKAPTDIDYFAAAFGAALTSSQGLEPAASDVVHQLNAFQALGADLAGTPSVNQHFVARFGELIAPVGGADDGKDQAFLAAAYATVYPGLALTRDTSLEYLTILSALRAQYGQDLMAKGALLARIAGEALVWDGPSPLTSAAAATLADLADGGTFKRGQLGDNVARAA